MGLSAPVWFCTRVTSTICSLKTFKSAGRTHCIKLTSASLWMGFLHSFPCGQSTVWSILMAQTYVPDPKKRLAPLNGMSLNLRLSAKAVLFNYLISNAVNVAGRISYRRLTCRLPVASMLYFVKLLHGKMANGFQQRRTAIILRALFLTRLMRRLIKRILTALTVAEESTVVSGVS